MKFSELNLDANILKGIDSAGFIDCLEVQEEAIPQILKNKDVMVQSQTGTGKTAAFLIPIFQLLLNSKEKNKSIIIVPTRELAVQIEKEAKLLCKYIDINTGCFYGGVGYAKQEKLLEEGVDIVIGTPGRILDLGSKNKIKFKEFGIVVIDEADRLFDMGFMPDIRKMLKQMPVVEKRTTMLFSATLNTRVKHLAWEYMNEAIEIELTPDQLTVEKINQKLYHVGKYEKMKLLLGILKKMSPKNTIIFTNTKAAAFEISNRLEYNGYKSEYLIGDLQQKKRLKIINDFKLGDLPILVATDVAARGLHVEDLELVVNYDLPTDCESYVHRIGRTARVGKSGEAISFACELFVYSLEAIESYIDMKIPVEWADEDQFIKDESSGRSFDFNKMMRNEKLGNSGKVESKKGNRSTHSRKIKSGKTDDNKDLIKKKNKFSQISKTKIAQTKTHQTKIHQTKTHQTKTHQTKIHQTKNVKIPVKKKTQMVKTPGNGNLEERLEYYKEKYGEDFKPSEELIRNEDNRNNISVFKKIFNIFKVKR